MIVSVFIVSSQCDYDEPYIEGVWRKRSDAESWVKMMQESWENVGDHHTLYSIKEYHVK